MGSPSGAVAVALLILLQPIVDAVRNFNDNLPRLIDDARHSDHGGFVNGAAIRLTL